MTDYYLVDVFAEKKYAGNQLAVFLNAGNISSEEMQAIAFETKLAARARFLPSAPLLDQQLLVMFDDPAHHQPPLLSKYLKLDERVVNYLLDSDELDVRLRPYARYTVPQRGLEEMLLSLDVKTRLTRLVQENRANQNGLIFYFQGPYGVGKQSTAEALGREVGIGLLNVQGDQLLEAAELPFETALKFIAREARLQNAALYWTGFDPLLAEDSMVRVYQLY